MFIFEEKQRKEWKEVCESSQNGCVAKCCLVKEWGAGEYMKKKHGGKVYRNDWWIWFKERMILYMFINTNRQVSWMVYFWVGWVAFNPFTDEQLASARLPSGECHSGS